MSPTNPWGKRPRPQRAGSALADALIAMIILTVAVGTLAGTVSWGLRLRATNEETAIAERAARDILANLRSVPFDQALATWSAAPDVTVAALNAQPDDPDGRVAEIRLPLVGGQLREDQDLPNLGFPRDLNGDGIVDAADHSGDYVILPVTVRLAWRGMAGDMQQEFHMVLVP